MKEFKIEKEFIELIDANDIIDQVISDKEKLKLSKSECKNIEKLKNDKFFVEEFEEKRDFLIGKVFNNEDSFITSLVNIVLQHFKSICSNY